MAVNQVDLNELKRIATNAYDGDKAFVHRVMKGISDYEKIIQSLKLENEKLRKELQQLLSVQQVQE
jgi:hypothetical protein